MNFRHEILETSSYQTQHLGLDRYLDVTPGQTRTPGHNYDS